MIGQLTPHRTILTSDWLTRRQAERMTDTFGLETVSALLARAETAGAGAGAAQCVVCGAAAASRCRIYSLISSIISTALSIAYNIYYHS